MKIVIVGGVAAGASAAAKARRCSEEAEIVIFERGPHISYANCGLPYYLSGRIEKRDKLLITDVAFFKRRFGVTIHTGHEVIQIMPEKKAVLVKNTASGEQFEEAYDKLILAMGANALIPPLPGVDNPCVFTLKTLEDTDHIDHWIKQNKPQKAVVIGGGLIGMEAVENFVALGIEVSVVEFLPQVLGYMDREMAELVHQGLTKHDVSLYLGEKVEKIGQQGGGAVVITDTGRELSADLIIMAVGVRPNIALAKEAGLRIGETGGIWVNAFMQTSNPDIYAAGDCIESSNIVTGKPALVPMGAAANKQGRAAGANACGRSLEVKGFTGTAIVKVFELAVAKTGLSEAEAVKAGFDPYCVYVLAGHHAGYYPGSKLVRLKIIAEEQDGRILGAQAIGEEGVDKRIDVLATAIYNKMTLEELLHLDLAYAPPYSSARDPIIVAGALGQNKRVGDWQPIAPHAVKDKLKAKDDFVLLDVRSAPELKKSGRLPGALHIPIDDLRSRLDELDRQREIVVYCAVGLRSYLAQRILELNGFEKVKTLTGGFLSWTYELQHA